MKLSDIPVIPTERRSALPVTLPDTAIAIPQDRQKRDLYPIRTPASPKFVRRPSLATRRRARFI